MICDKLELQRALHRGCVQAAMAQVELEGVPIDTKSLGILRARLADIKLQTAIIASARFGGVYAITFGGEPGLPGRHIDEEGVTIIHQPKKCIPFEIRFQEDVWDKYGTDRGWRWPRHPDTGRLKLDDKPTFRDQARLRPRIQLLRDARKLMRWPDLAFTVGADGRNRCMQSAFSTKTGRCAPSTAKFIFAAPKWMRGLIKPAEGRAVAEIDLRGADYGVMAALSKDPAMQVDYRPDPHIKFAIRAKAVPPGATKTSHPRERAIYKTANLAVAYGQGPESLGMALGIQSAEAAMLLAMHRRCYPRYWKWSNNVSSTAHVKRKLYTKLGWPLQVTGWSDNDRSLRNYPVQGTVSDILHLSLLYAHEAGICVVATVHDSVLIESTLEKIGEDVATMRTVMREASADLLDGFELDTDVGENDSLIIRYPNRYPTTETWDEVCKMVGL